MEDEALKTGIVDKYLWKFKTLYIFIAFAHSVPVSSSPASFYSLPVEVLGISQNEIKYHCILSFLHSWQLE